MSYFLFPPFCCVSMLTIRCPISLHFLSLSHSFSRSWMKYFPCFPCHTFRLAGCWVTFKNFLPCFRSLAFRSFFPSSSFTFNVCFAILLPRSNPCLHISLQEPSIRPLLLAFSPLLPPSSSLPLIPLRHPSPPPPPSSKDAFLSSTTTFFSVGKTMIAWSLTLLIYCWSSYLLQETVLGLVEHFTLGLSFTLSFIMAFQHGLKLQLATLSKLVFLLSNISRLPTSLSSFSFSAFIIFQEGMVSQVTEITIKQEQVKKNEYLPGLSSFLSLRQY